MRRLFDFQPKIGWGEIIAIAAVIISIYTLVTQDKINASVVQEISHSFDYIYVKTDQRVHIFYDRAVITNIGAKPFSILGISAIEDDPWNGNFLLVVRNELTPGRILKHPLSIFTKQEIVILKPKMFLWNKSFEEIQKDEEMHKMIVDVMERGKELSAEQLKHASMRLELGSTAIINLGAIIDHERIGNRGTLHFGYNLRISDGSSHRLARSYPVVDIQPAGSRQSP